MSGAQSAAAIGVERSAPAVELIEHDPEQLARPEHESFPAARTAYLLLHHSLLPVYLVGMVTRRPTA